MSCFGLVSTHVDEFGYVGNFSTQQGLAKLDWKTLKPDPCTPLTELGDLNDI